MGVSISFLWWRDCWVFQFKKSPYWKWVDNYEDYFWIANLHIPNCVHFFWKMKIGYPCIFVINTIANKFLLWMGLWVPFWINVWIISRLDLFNEWKISKDLLAVFKIIYTVFLWIDSSNQELPPEFAFGLCYLSQQVTFKILLYEYSLLP